jgi:hypothetical protein
MTKRDLSIEINVIITITNTDTGVAVTQLVEALRYKPKGRGFY